MQTVKTYTLALSTYNGEIVGRLRFQNAQGETEESALYSLGELSNMLALWKMGAMLGSFAINSILSPSADFQMVQA